MFKRFDVVLLSLMLMSAACGAPEPVEAPPPVQKPVFKDAQDAYNQLKQRIQKRWCAQTFRCPEVNTPVYDRMANHLSQASCEMAWFGFRFLVWDPERVQFLGHEFAWVKVEQALNRGVMAYDKDEATQCAAALDAGIDGSCSEGQLANLPQSCARVFTHTLDENGACADSSACEKGFACSAYDVCGDGSCFALLKEGEPCSTIGGTNCEEGTICVAKDANSDDGVCTRYVLKGKGEDEPCDFNAQCKDSLFCTGYSGVCKPLPTVGKKQGEACRTWFFEGELWAPSLHCAPGLGCVHDYNITPSTMGRCQPLVGEGESCAEALCKAGLYCRGGSICKVLEDIECSDNPECPSNECINGRCAPFESERACD